MAKRRRLTPRPAPSETSDAPRAPEAKGVPNPVQYAGSGPIPAHLRDPGAAPVAAIAGEAAAAGALREMADVLASARAEGRLALSLPLDAVRADHLHRDRLLDAGPDDAADPTADPVTGEEMGALIDSLRSRGQQVPVDVVRLDERSYGLISGLRRLTALRHLHRTTGEDRFGRVSARVVAPESLSEAYRAMIEENEIRAPVSFYERARVALKAVEAGAFPDLRAALAGLYGNVPRARRSKIGSFVPVVEALDGALRHPGALTEKRGLALANALHDDPGLAARLRATLDGLGAGSDRAEAEQAALEAALTPVPGSTPVEEPVSAVSTDPVEPREDPVPLPEARPEAPSEIPSDDVRLSRRGGRIVLEGPGVDAGLEAALRDWLSGR